MTGIDLGPFIVARRLQLGLNQGQLAERAGINRAHLSQIESGKITRPSPDMRRRIALGLRLPHIDMMVPAGELHAEELPGGVSPVVDFPENSPAARVVDIMRTLPDEYIRWILGTAEFAEKEARGERDDDLSVTVNTASRKVGA